MFGVAGIVRREEQKASDTGRCVAEASGPQQVQLHLFFCVEIHRQVLPCKLPPGRGKFCFMEH